MRGQGRMHMKLTRGAVHMGTYGEKGHRVVWGKGGTTPQGFIRGRTRFLSSPMAATLRPHAEVLQHLLHKSVRSTQSDSGFNPTLCEGLACATSISGAESLAAAGLSCYYLRTAGSKEVWWGAGPGGPPGAQ